jgi:hypothetical protein
VIASALAAVAFAEQVQPRLIAAKITRNISQAQDNMTVQEAQIGRNVADYLKKIGMYGSA